MSDREDEGGGAGLDSRLVESEERYRAVIENASDMIQSCRTDGTFEFTNRAWREKLGYSEDELAHMNIWDIVHPDSRSHCEVVFGEAMRGTNIERVQAVFLTKDGRPLPVEGNATARYVDGEVIATHSFFSDISERLRADELEERNEQLEREQMARYLEKMAALGKLSAGLAHELNNPAAAVQRASAQLEESLSRRDGVTRQLNAHLASPHWEMLQSLLDSPRDGAPDERPPLEVSAREEAIEDWLGDHGVADAWELAAGLAQVGVEDSVLDRVAEGLPEAALGDALTWLSESYAVRDLLRTTGNGAHRISELVSAVKAYTFMDRAAEQVVDVHEGLENTLIILGHELKNMTVRRDFDRSLPPVRAVGSGLNQVWTNILDNAIDATQAQGAIGLRTAREGEMLVVEISDDGPGIPEEHITRIFEPFFSTKSQGAGTGLGLDMAWRIITEEHRGTIEVDSEPGRTTFRVALPLDS